MKKQINFSSKDKPANMGKIHDLEAGKDSDQDVLDWAQEEGRAQFLPNPKIEGDLLTFDIGTGDDKRRGQALLSDIPDDFEN